MRLYRPACSLVFFVLSLFFPLPDSMAGLSVWLNTGAYCIVDVHTYARFNGRIIGQGGPSNSVFASLWTSIANHYKSNSKIIFDIMNEPHDGKCPRNFSLYRKTRFQI